MRILLILIGRVGDLLTATSFIAAMREKYPKARISLLVREQTRDLASLIPEIDEIAILPKPQHVPGYAILAKFLAGKFDLCVELNPAYSRMAGFLTLASRAPARVSFEKKRAHWFYNRSVGGEVENEHMFASYKRLAGYFGAPYKPEYRVAIPASDETAAQKIFTEMNFGTGFKVAAHPGNFKKFNQRWPEEKFQELVKKIISLERTEIVYLAGPGETEKVGAMAAEFGGKVKFLPARPLGVTAAFLKRMNILIANSTGTMHLAAACGTPTLTFHNKSSALVWAPQGEKHSVLISESWTSCREIPVETAWEEFKKISGRALDIGRG